jgi:hypothetical protein
VKRLDHAHPMPSARLDLAVFCVCLGLILGILVAVVQS